MKKSNPVKSHLIGGIVLFLLFILLTAALQFIDVRQLGPEGTSIGFAAINGAVFSLFPYNEIFFNISEPFRLFSFLVAGCWAIYGLAQWISRKSLKKVDPDVLILGALFALTIIAYFFFERFAVNYRPVILEEGLEASFPSSHTMVVLVVLGATAEQLSRRLRRGNKVLPAICWVLIGFTVAARLVSGVHWLTDIAAGILLAASFLCFYLAGVNAVLKNKDAAQ